jgi:transcriptional regulator with XRE-family HTH domain
MYYNIRFEMLRKNISIEDIAQTLGVSRDTASRKLKGKAKLYVDELVAIRNSYFSDKSLDALIAKDNHL